MTLTKPAHFAVVPLAAWGHVRPILHLSLNILILHPTLHLTLLLAPSVAPRVEKELKSARFAHIHKPSPPTSTGPSPDGSPVPEGRPAVERLQIVNVVSEKLKDVGKWDAATMAMEAQSYAETIPSYISMLFGGEQVDGFVNRFQDVAPGFIIYDVFQSFVPEVITATLGALNKPMPALLGFCPCNGAACFHHFAKAEHNGCLELMLNAVAADTAKGRDVWESWAEHGFESTGKVIKLPDLLPAYDYEYRPQQGAVPLPPQVCAQVSSSIHAVRHPATTAVILPALEEFEPESKAALLEELGKPCLMAGLQFPESTWEGVKISRDTSNPDDERILSFLDRMEAKHGPRSVAYVSFGSAFFPASRPELVEYLLASLIENKVPFVFAHATELFNPPQSLIDMIEPYEDGESVKFAPQWQVLEHPATQFFLSHCGSNSTAEGILSGVPIVSMPFSADQGEFASMLSNNFKVAIDLKQVKTFKEGLDRFNKLYDGTVVLGTEEAIKKEMAEVWARVRGQEGDEMRKRMEGLREVAYKSWKQGKSRETMVGLQQYF